MAGEENVEVRGDRHRAVDAGVDPGAWRRVHWITPVLNSWQVIALLVFAVFLQSLEQLQQLLTSPSTSLSTVLLLAAGAVILLTAVVGGYSYLAWRATSFAVTDHAVWLRSGVLFRNQKHVRLERIQSVDLIHPLLGRLLGLGKLSVESAGAGGDLRIGYLKSPELTSLRAEIMARAAGVFRDAEWEPEVPSAGEERSDAPFAEAPESVVYTVPPGRLIGSLLLSSASAWAFVGLVCGILLVLVAARGGVWMQLLALLPLLLAGFVVGWSRFATEFDFQAAVSPDGIRIRRGLLETRSETIPPRRVHAVSVSQPLFWRPLGWYRVRFSQATHPAQGGDKNTQSGVLLPVGSKTDAMLAIWLVLPDLGVDDVEQFFVDSMKSSGRTPGFVSLPARAWVFDPLTFRRKALALTRTAMVVRDGLLTRTLSVVPYSRIQSLVVIQGPLSSPLHLAGLRAATVPGPVTVQIDHLTEDSAREARDRLVVATAAARGGEPPERWFARVQSVGSDAEPEDPHS